MYEYKGMVKSVGKEAASVFVLLAARVAAK
jgi:hypothetical protein